MAMARRKSARALSRSPSFSWINPRMSYQMILAPLFVQVILTLIVAFMLAKLSAQNRFALAFRTHNMKTEAGRKKKIEAFVAMLKRGETIYPQGKK